MPIGWDFPQSRKLAVIWISFKHPAAGLRKKLFNVCNHSRDGALLTRLNAGCRSDKGPPEMPQSPPGTPRSSAKTR